MVVSPPTEFLQTFQAMRGNWFAAVQGPAQNLFGLLAIIEFAWSAAVLALERTDLQSWTAGLLRKLMWLGAFYALLLFGPTWIPAIIDSFTQLGQQAAGLGPLQPGDVFQRGLDIGGALFSGASDAGFFTNFGTAMAMVFAAILSFVSFCFISIQLVAALVESYIVVTAAFIFLGFGGSRWSAPYVEKYIALTVGVGVKIMILYLLIGVGMALSAGWVAAATAVAGLPTPAMGALDILGESLISLALCWFVPKIVAGVLGGTPAFTGGEVIAVATPIVYGAAMAGNAVVGLATSGYGTLAGAGAASSPLAATVAPPAPTSAAATPTQPSPPPPSTATPGTVQPPPPPQKA
ncbi:MAG: P-type conjugative transfer protein TrbL [Acidobacteriia bacterium]|nr:P-type conjugative transfer protein TrbL [Terriglobia bacterium]